tara:strand:- start:323 stop:442 length:120 start_codon:yes stop_codon:yes gene_type:complete
MFAQKVGKRYKLLKTRDYGLSHRFYLGGGKVITKQWGQK